MKEKISKDRFNKLKDEIIMAERLLDDQVMPQMIEAVRRYTGKYVPIMAKNWDIVLNEVYPIIQYEMPAIFFRNPRAFLKPRNKTFIVKKRDPITGQMQETMADSTKSAQTQEALLNYTVDEIKYKEEARRVLMDALIFKYGVMWHGYKGEFGMTEENSMYIEDESIFVRRISPMHFLWDPTVPLSRLDEAKWIARVFWVPKQDILEDETLDVDKKQIKGELGYGVKIGTNENGQGGNDTKVLRGSQTTLLDYASDGFKKSDASKFVKCYEVLHRPTKKEKREGSKGRIVLFTKDQDRPLNENAWPYKVPDWPAKPLIFNHVPEMPFPMADMEVWSPLADQKNMLINLQLKNASTLSKVLVAVAKSNMSEEDIQKIREGESMVIPVDGDNVANRLSAVSLSQGASTELYTADTRVQANLDEKSGVMDLRKGLLRTGEESATSVKIRSMGTSGRQSYRQDIMVDFLRDSFLFINHLIKQFYPIDKAVRIVGSLDIEWSNNPSKEEIQADVDVELDVISMLPEDPDTELQKDEAVLNMMKGAIDDPNMMQKILQEGNTFNVSPIIKNMLYRLKQRDPDTFRAIKPEESQGFVSVAEVRAAGQNVKAALSGQQPPSPPQPGQDHTARLELYSDIFGLIQGLGDTQASQTMQQLIQMQQLMQQNEQKVKNPLDKPIKLTGGKRPVNV